MSLEHTRVPVWLRELWRTQQTFVFMGVIVYALLAVLNVKIPLTFGGMILLVLSVGNVVSPLTILVRPVFQRLRSPWDWVVVLPLQIVLGFIAAFYSAVFLWIVLRPQYEFGKTLKLVTPPTVVSTLIFGLAVFYHQRHQEQLRLKAERLELAVARGSVELHAQEQELIRAREIQQALLPKMLPQLPAVAIAGAWQPARTVSGDYFDVIRLGDEALGICIADVSGKGITAALLMANLQAAFRAFATPDATPASVCSRLNTFLCGNVASGKFITFLYAILNMQDGTLTYENAGHCPGLLLKKSGSAEALSGNGAVLGVLPEWTYRDSIVRLEQGDRVFFYTDGVTEAENSSAEEFSEERLILAAREGSDAEEALATQQRIMKEVTTFCNNAFHDDATLIVVSVKDGAQSGARGGDH